MRDLVLNKYLQNIPIVIFAICIVIAILLTLMAPSFWPAALAIAISGGALALALRSQDNREISYLTDDITILQEQNSVLQKQAAEFKAELVKNNEMLDELADIVEQVATLTADGGDITKSEVEALRGEISEMRTLSIEKEEPEQVISTNDPRVDELEVRLAALESQPATNAPAKVPTSDAALGLAGAAAAATTISSDDQGSVRSLMARANGDTTSTPDEPATQIPAEPKTNATLAPVFQPDLGEPIAFMLRPVGEDGPDRLMAILDHAVNISAELEAANRENLLFVNLSSKTLADPAVCESILAAVAKYSALQRRLIILTGQPNFSDAALQNLTAIAAEGCRFGLYDVRDWSLNLAALARDGMAFILVDGPAMARSAEDQGGDPRRLTQALSMHNISLIAGGVETETDIQSANGLEPTFVTGSGLGETRALETTS